jgi:hypothetical protein
MNKDHLTQTYKHLIRGKLYKVAKPFTDFKGDNYLVGDQLEFIGSNYLPYDAGLSLFFNKNGKEIQIMLCLQKEFQQGIEQQLDQYFKLVENCLPQKSVRYEWVKRKIGSNSNILSLTHNEIVSAIDGPAHASGCYKVSVQDFLCDKSRGHIENVYGKEVLNSLLRILNDHTSFEPIDDVLSFRNNLKLSSISPDLVELNRLLFKFDFEIGSRFLESLFNLQQILPPELIALSFYAYDAPLLAYNNRVLIEDNDFDVLISRLKNNTSVGSFKVGMQLLDAMANYAVESQQLRRLHHIKDMANVVEEQNFEIQKDRLNNYILQAWSYNYVEIFEDEYMKRVFEPFKDFYNTQSGIEEQFNRMREHSLRWLINEDYLIWGDAFAELTMQTFKQEGIDINHVHTKRMMSYINGQSTYTSGVYISNYLKNVPVNPAEHFTPKNIKEGGTPKFLKQEGDKDQIAGRMLNYLYYFHESGAVVTPKRINNVLNRIEETWNSKN